MYNAPLGCVEKLTGSVLESERVVKSAIFEQVEERLADGIEVWWNRVVGANH